MLVADRIEAIGTRFPRSMRALESLEYRLERENLAEPIPERAMFALRANVLQRSPPFPLRRPLFRHAGA